MHVEFEKTGPCFGKLSVTVESDRVDEAFAKAYRAVAKNARIAGFRPGKAPRQVIEAHYADQIRGDVENELIRNTLHVAVLEKDVALVATPRIAPGKLEKGSDFSYTAELETKPEIELVKYQGLAVPTIEAAVKEEDVDAELAALREQAVQMVPVLDRDVVADGDLVLVDYEATQGGMPLEGGTAKGALVEVGGEDYIPGLGAALLGRSVPGQVSVPVDFPDDFAIPAWQGKKVTFRVELKELKKKDYPDLDDEFAQDLGEESLAALTQKIRDDLEARQKKQVEGERRRAVLQALVKANPFDVPPSMIAEQTDRMIVDAATRVRQMMGPRFNLGDLDIEALRRDNREHAEHNVRSGLLLLEVSKAAGIEVSEDEISAEVERLAEAMGDEAGAERARAHYAAAEERERLKYRLLEDKTLAFLLENAVAGPAEAPPEASSAEAPAEP